MPACPLGDRHSARFNIYNSSMKQTSMKHCMFGSMIQKNIIGLPWSLQQGIRVRALRRLCSFCGNVLIDFFCSVSVSKKSVAVAFGGVIAISNTCDPSDLHYLWQKHIHVLGAYSALAPWCIYIHGWRSCGSVQYDISYDYFNVRSKADRCQLNLPHRTKN